MNLNVISNDFTSRNPGGYYRNPNKAVLSFKVLIVLSIVLFLVVFFSDLTDSELLVANLIAFTAYNIAGFFFMYWFYHTYTALYLTPRLKLTIRPIWTFIGFSFPVANLFVPYLLFATTWKSGYLLSKNRLNNEAPVKTPRYLLIWWIQHLFCFMVAPWTYFMTYSVTNLSKFNSLLSLSFYCAIVPTSLLGIRYLNSIERKMMTAMRTSNFGKTLLPDFID